MGEKRKEERLQEIISLARENTIYFRNLYHHFPEDSYLCLDNLPVTNLEEYWQIAREDSDKVLTCPFKDGIPIRSGGSTTDPKTSFLTRDELKINGQLTGKAWADAGLLLPGDRLVNLYSFGGMYGGFQLVNKAIEEAPVPIVHLPLSATHPFDQVLQEIDFFQATTVISPVFNITRLADHITRSGGSRPMSIRLIMFSGETLSTTVAKVWREAFPNAVFHPMLYSSCDSTALAVVPHATRDLGEWHVQMATDAIYHNVEEASIIELLDDDGKVIRQPGIPGHTYITSLIRKLQPVIRYPLGDLACWVDYDAQSFRFIGRGSLAVKLVGTWLPMITVKKILSEVLDIDVGGRLQCVTRYEGVQTVLLFRLALESPADECRVRDEVDFRIRAISGSWGKARQAGGIAPLRFEWVGIDGLVFLQRSGKLQEVIDDRV